MEFKIEEATIRDIRLAFRGNKLTPRELVQYYLNAIAKLNPKLSAVIEVNPDALTHAQEVDRKMNLPGGCSFDTRVMEGIPVILKDNIATKDKLNTTSGSYALYGSVVPRDAGVVDRLRQAGAIILGKAGLTEWANFRTEGSDEQESMPNGWSARGGTVKNPYVLTADPGGSSTGSAVSVAANLVTVSLGTETSRSIIEPCSVNGVVGIKPTLGLTSRSGVIPITLRQDTVGPIGRTVSDAVYLLDVIVGYDPRDEITKEAAQYIPRDGFKQFLNTDGLSGKRIGNLWGQFKIIYDEDPSSPKPEIFQQRFNTISQKGAVLLDLNMSHFMELMRTDENGSFLAMKYEFKRDLNTYLSNLLESPIRSLADAITFNKDHPEEEKLNEYGQTLFIDSEKTNLPSDEYTEAVENLTTLLKDNFEKFMTDNNLDAFVAPEHLGANILGCGGYPGIIVPAGFDSEGVPFGILFGGLKGSDAKLIEIAYAFEQATSIRKPPTLPT